MSTTGTTKTDLNLRQSPSVQATILEKLPKSTPLTILDDTDQTSGWLHVTAPDGQVGYAAIQFVDIAAASSMPPSSSTPSKLLVPNVPGGHALNVRSTPAIATNPDNRVDQVKTGETMAPLENDGAVAAKVGTTQPENQWIQVQTPRGISGFVGAWLVAYALSTTVTPPVVTPPVVTPPVVTPP